MCLTITAIVYCLNGQLSGTPKYSYGCEEYDRSDKNDETIVHREIKIPSDVPIEPSTYIQHIAYLIFVKDMVVDNFTILYPTDIS